MNTINVAATSNDPTELAKMLTKVANHLRDQELGLKGLKLTDPASNGWAEVTVTGHERSRTGLLSR